MVQLLTLLISIIGKALNIGAKVVLNRATFIIIFIGTMTSVVIKIFSALDDANSGINKMFDFLSNTAFSFAGYVEGNSFFELCVYCLSLDTLYDVMFTWLFWFFISLLSVALTITFFMILQVLPMLAEIFSTSIKKQFAKIVAGNGPSL